MMDEADERVIANERLKLTASYINAGAGTALGAGVIAPIAAAVFGVVGSGGPVPALVLAVGVMMFLATSVVLHLIARRILRRLKA